MDALTEVQAAMNNEDDVTLLLGRLQEVITLLRKWNRDAWADSMQGSYELIAKGDFSGITHLLGAYGGMGSFNDIVIHPTNGDLMPSADVEPVNMQLEQLRGDIWRLATKIKQGHQGARE